MPHELNDLIPTRYSLLNRLKDWGDQRSWQDFFDTYWRLIYEVALKAGLTEVEAQEVVQETVIAVAKKIDSLKGDPQHGSFKAWLMHLTRWRIADQFRKRQAGPAPSYSGGGDMLSSNETRTATVDRIPDPSGIQLEAVWDAEWEKNLMTAALEAVKQRVSPRQFQMFDLHVLQELPVARVSRILKVSAMQVYLAKHRVGRLLKKEIARRESLAV